MSVLDILADERLQRVMITGVAWIREQSRQSQLQRSHDEHIRRQEALQQEVLSRLNIISDKFQPEAKAANVQTPAPIARTKPPIESAPVYSNYAPDMDVSVACVACTRSHLSTIAQSLQSGNAQAAREEMAALMAYDLTPEKLSATPARDQAVLQKYAGKITALQASLAGDVPQATEASASLKEALRFARQDGMQHPEVQLRLQRTEDVINQLERVQFSPEQLAKMPLEQAKRVRDALPELRHARQELVNHTQTPEDLERVAVAFATLDQTLNTAPDEGQTKDAAIRARKLNTEFRKDVLAAWGGAKTHEAHVSHEPGRDASEEGAYAG